jgi:Lrp/AsnC family leucine-responsive transcriptional regulator
MRKSRRPARRPRVDSALKNRKRFKLDETDYLILSMLQGNARISNAEIARQAKMVPSGILERLRKLEENKIILGYETRFDSRALGCELLAFVFVRAREKNGRWDTAAQLAKIPEVQEVQAISGEDCYLMKFRTGNPHELAALLRTKVQTIPSVQSTRSTIVLDTVKETGAIPLEKGRLD